MINSLVVNDLGLNDCFRVIIELLIRPFISLVIRNS